MKKSSLFFNIAHSDAIGVDVSKADLHIGALSGETYHYVPIANQSSAIDEWILSLVEHGYSGKIILESTCRYHWLLQLKLSEAGLDVRVVNPLMSSKHIKGSVRKTKTDKQDAYVLAAMCFSEPNLPSRAATSRNTLHIKHKMGLVRRLEKQLQSLTGCLKSYEQTASDLTLELSAVEQSLWDTVSNLKKQREILLKEIEQLAGQLPQVSEKAARLQSIPGYSAFVSSLLSALLSTDVRNAKSWVAYVGCDVSIKESGRYKGRGRLTKRGNSYLRKRLYAAAWGAVMNYGEIRAYYDQLKRSGKNHVEALIMIARKQLTIAFHLIKNKVNYQSEQAKWA